ncbi:hypothetical protein [Marmoricola sp. RAF53]|uniref:hypothetical protein n=1 Tax=Marmoricola sp. RAF53 TaxID=3233059 RepID=UPI003F9BAE56
MAGPAESAAQGGRDWLEVIVTVLLVVAALGTSWSSYQATRWNGEQAKATARTNAIRIEAARAQGLAQAQTQVDVATWIAWSGADRAGDQELADFYEQRFRPGFKPAFAAWEATKPLTNPDAPPTPFAMPEYRATQTADAERLDQEAAASAERVGRNIQRASNYVLTVVLYAVVLFFAGVSTRIHDRRLRRILVGVGTAVLIGNLIWISTFPVSVTV